MRQPSILTATLSPLLLLASCGNAADGDNPPADVAFTVTEHGRFDRPWAAAFLPGTPLLFITEKAGTMKFVDTASGKQGNVAGTPSVDFGGQGGFGDVAFLPGEAAASVGTRTIYLSWVEAGGNDTRGAVVGKGMLSCPRADACTIEDLDVIWRQHKVTGRGHYSHRLAFSPDGQYLFVSSGDRQKMEPAQDTSNNLGSVVRLNLDGTPAADNAFTGEAGKAQDIWSYGHRNLLGLAFDLEGRLWEVEHGPAGGDELNRVEKGANYGWPRVSDGDHYDGTKIPDNATSTAYHQSAITWTPVIAPGSLIFYRGDLFPGFQGHALIAGLLSNAIVRVAIDGDTAREVARYGMDSRIRGAIEGPDGALWVIEDGQNGRLLELRPR
ncbi:PQQ-dependent sugar dehydrogenase [Erythrobacter mangrovi]|uniref:PQQ-dependent sugar dehydrogenase n=1 Tax=Erythrobacter mangrovi TaxID=2739433 RepID=A0A7D3X8F7_9SPHN|nr:PQQ-dependent sugar dehydrogenase [Erythrobacter mangrovi]QKG70035.1 PQQ-dependent sugar dehydrogenase [Erythrobacter mangrovi]